MYNFNKMYKMYWMHCSLEIVIQNRTVLFIRKKKEILRLDIFQDNPGTGTVDH